MKTKRYIRWCTAYFKINIILWKSSNGLILKYDAATSGFNNLTPLLKNIIKKSAGNVPFLVFSEIDLNNSQPSIVY